MSQKSGSLFGSLFSLVSSSKTAPKSWSERELTEWFIKRVAEATDTQPNAIDVNRPFVDFGLDSRTAVALSSELERVLGRELPPTLIWDYPSIQEVTKYLLSESPTDPPISTSDESVAK